MTAKPVTELLLNTFPAHTSAELREVARTTGVPISRVVYDFLREIDKKLDKVMFRDHHGNVIPMPSGVNVADILEDEI